MILSLSTQEQDAAIGRLVRENDELRRTIPILVSEAERHGRAFARAGEYLAGDLRNGEPPAVLSSLDVEKARAIANDALAALQRKKEVVAALTEMGFLPAVE